MAHKTATPQREAGMEKDGSSAMDHPPIAAWYLPTVLLAGLAALVLTVLLPFSDYTAWQSGAGTDMVHARWVYERLHFDRSPIAVAVIGSSRLEAGISPRALAADLGQRLGRDTPVANLSIFRPGRDLQFEIVEHLLATHPEVRLIVLADDGFMANSHPMYQATAPARGVLSEPLLINTNWFTSVAALPYRALRNCAAQWAPALFGVAPEFAPGDYAGAQFDRTEGYVLPSGEARNGNLRKSQAALAADAKKVLAIQNAGLIGRVRLLPPAWQYAVDLDYTQRIAAVARRAGVPVAFVALPMYGPVRLKGDRRLYCRYGPDFDLSFLADHPGYYQDGLHLNHDGALAASAALAEQIAPMLAPGTPPPPTC
jgi:hypothetical protein